MSNGSSMTAETLEKVPDLWLSWWKSLKSRSISVPRCHQHINMSWNLMCKKLKRCKKYSELAKTWSKTTQRSRFAKGRPWEMSAPAHARHWSRPTNWRHRKWRHDQHDQHDQKIPESRFQGRFKRIGFNACDAWAKGKNSLKLGRQREHPS